MNIHDITESWKSAAALASFDPGDHPNDYINWKVLRSAGATHVRIDGVVYNFSKHGLLDPVEEQC